MTEHPILFSVEMVRAILDGRKTQTRRVIKKQPRISCELATVLADGTAVFDEAHGYDVHKYKCPYGAPGDTLWVRETWATVKTYDNLNPSKIPRGSAGRWPSVWYAADPGEAGLYSLRKHNYQFLGKTRPSIFLPRWASRTNLLVKNIRVERVQDITYLDAIAEGMDKDWPEKSYRDLWDKLNAKRGYGWDVNPWVWVIEFEVMK